MKLSLIKTHLSTHIKLLIFKMSSLDYRFIPTRKIMIEKMNKFESKFDKIIAIVKHILNQNQFSSRDNDVEDDGLS